MQYRQLSGKILYLILWGGTAVIAAGMVFFGHRQQVYYKKLFSTPNFAMDASSGDAINKLLISADELNIAEKTSFINLYLKQGDEAGIVTSQKVNKNREEVYKRIFQRKINKLNGKPSEDFSVRPIPK